ncbi:MAG: DNA-formamidopyrimidine glycosylase [Bacilli bacterium]|jgi:formamidopyrimidine-DNA glycosylase
MPELPEVETIRRVLASKVTNNEIKSVDVYVNRIVRTDLDAFKSDLKGQTITNVARIGKYLLFYFTSNLCLVSHLRLEGKYYYLRVNEENPDFTCVVFNFTNGYKLVYADSRKFGTMDLVKESELSTLKSLTSLGPEPFDTDGDYLYSKTSKTSRPIKTVLLDQTVLAGLGNIYVDEVLFLTKIHPLTKANLLTHNDCVNIIENSIAVLNKAIEQGGSTIRSYSSLNGETGHFQQSLLAYGRKGEECFRCKTKLKQIFIGGRSSVYCPKCQKNPSLPLTIAITGLIGAGKTTLLNYLKEKGYKTLSADEIVSKLYKDVEISKKIQKLFSNNILSEDQTINKALLFKELKDNPKTLNALNNIVHPLVKEELIKEINNTKEQYLFVEIALPFSHKINELFNYIIGVETSLSKQLAYLENRKSYSPLISPDEEYKKHRSELDFIIINDKTTQELFETIEQIIAVL